MEIKLKEIELRIPVLSLPELKILHMSDFHLCGDNPKIEKAFKGEIHGKDFDFIFLRGDLVDNDKGIDPLINYLSLLNSRYGIYCV